MTPSVAMDMPHTSSDTGATHPLGSAGVLQSVSATKGATPKNRRDPGDWPRFTGDRFSWLDLCCHLSDQQRDSGRTAVLRCTAGYLLSGFAWAAADATVPPSLSTFWCG
jgi:hypothetical protein